MKKLFVLLMFLSISSIVAYADIAQPPQPRPTPTPTPEATDSELYITLSREVTETTLHIKKSALAKFAAEFGDAEKASSAGSGSTQTVVGGVFLSLGVFFGGVWLMRGKKQMPKPVGAAAIISISALAGTVVYANIAPPKRHEIDQTIFSKTLQGYAAASGKIKVLVVDNEYGEDFVLFVPRNADKSNKKEE